MGPTFEPIDHTDESLCLMTWDEFAQAVQAGGFIDYDGFGELATEDKVSNVVIYPSIVKDFKRPAWATHVSWYNK